MTSNRFRVVIPARFGSTRLPGKPLRKLAGRPLIAHVWARAVAAGATDVVVATDDERIVAAVVELGGRAVMTAVDHESGTDRLAEVAAREGWGDDEIVVNLQGDEPTMPAELIRAVAAALPAHPDAGIATLATPIATVAELFDLNVVKVVIDDQGKACYFSRAPIPWVRAAFTALGEPPAELPHGVTFLRHLGLYAYRVGVLRRVAGASPRAGELAESLEQLRALAMGVAIQVGVTARAPGPGVDTEEDLAAAELELGRSDYR